MSRVEKFEELSETASVEAMVDEDDLEMRLWLMAGRWAQTFTILGFLASGCALLFYHL